MTETSTRYTSMRSVMEVIQEIVPSDEDVEIQKAKPFDYAKNARRLKELGRKIHLGLKGRFHVTGWKCAGDIDLLLISEFPPLEEASKGVDDLMHRTGYVEFRKHRFKQRTFIWHDENSDAIWAVFTLLGYYKHWTIGHSWKRLLGMEKPKYRIAPIVWVAFSDGQAEIQDDVFRSSWERPVPEAQDVQIARDAFTSTLLEEAIGELENYSSEIKRLEKNEKDRERDNKRDGDEWAFRAIRDYEKTKKYPVVGARAWVANLFSMRAIRYLFYMAALLGFYIVVAWVLAVYFQIYLPNPLADAGTGGAADPGGGTTTGPVTAEP